MKRSCCVAVPLVLLLAGTLTACAGSPLDDLHRTFAPSPAAEMSDPPVADPSLVPADDLTGFAVPIWLTVPPGLTLAVREHRLLTWSVGDSPDSKVRLMAPTAVRIGGFRRAPADLHRYLVESASSGIRLVDDHPVALGGAPAHQFTLTVRHDVASGLWCWSEHPGDCFTISKGVTLRMVTFEVGGRPVVIWASSWTPGPEPELLGLFDELLATAAFEHSGRLARHRDEGAGSPYPSTVAPPAPRFLRDRTPEPPDLRTAVRTRRNVPQP